MSRWPAPAPTRRGWRFFQGQVEVVAPTERMERARTALRKYTRMQGRTGLQHLLAHVAHLQPIRVAVAHPCVPQPVRRARSAPGGVDRAGAGRAGCGSKQSPPRPGWT